MREIIIGLYEGTRISETIFITYPENTLQVQPFIGDIKDLKLIFKYADGKKKTITIHETGVARTIENVGLFECFWLEHSVAERNYFVRTTLS